MPLDLRLLGRFALTTGKDAPVAINGSRAKLLLARLALTPSGVECSVLGAMLWGDRAEAQARASLRQMVWTVRAALGDKAKGGGADLVLAEGALLRLNPAAVTVDVAAFERMAAASDPDEVARAMQLYRGELLEGIDLIGLAPDGYVLRERRRLHDLALQATLSLVATFVRDGRSDEAVRAARRGLALDPYHEALQGALVTLLHRSGRHHEARAQDEAFRQQMHSGLGVSLPPVSAEPKAGAVSLTVPGLAAAAATGPDDARTGSWTRGLGLAGAVALVHLTAALALLERRSQALMARDRLLALRPAANLHYFQTQYVYRNKMQNQRLLDGLRRAGIPDWPQGFVGNEADRLIGAAQRRRGQCHGRGRGAAGGGVSIGDGR